MTQSLIRGVAALASAVVIQSGCSSGGLDEGDENVASTSDALICNAQAEVGWCALPTWANGVFRYELASSPLRDQSNNIVCEGGFFTPGEQADVEAAMRTWERLSGNAVTFVSATSGSRIIIHKKVGSGFMPYPPAPNFIHHGCLAPLDLTNNPGGIGWNTRHELGHGLGLNHTMRRNDRNRYITLDAAFWCKAPAGTFEAPVGTPSDLGYYEALQRCGDARPQRDFPAAVTFTGDRSDFGPFDVGSVMEYATGCSAGTCSESFTGCTNGDCAIVPRGGGNISLAPDVQPSDGSAVAELYAEPLDWQRFRPSPTSDPTTIKPLNYELSTGVSLSGSPAIVRVSDDTVALARGTDNVLYTKWFATRRGAWTKHSTVSVLGGDPAAMNRGNGTLELATLSGSTVTYRAYSDVGVWTSTSLGTPPGNGQVSAPAIAACSATTFSVFVIRSNKLLEKRFNGSSWSGWNERSTAILTGKPAVASWGSQRYDVVAVNSANGSIEQFASNDCGATWATANLGGIANSGTSPAIASPDSGRLSVFVTGTNGLLYEKKYSGSWQPWVAIGGLLESSSPAATRAWDGSLKGMIVAAKLAERTGSSNAGLWTRNWAPCPAANSNGLTNGFCSSLCPCNEAQADCDDELNSTDCNGDLRCVADFGARYGYASNFDVCTKSGCTLLQPNSPCVLTCPCAAGGACSNHEQCLKGLSCVNGTCQ